MSRRMLVSADEAAPCDSQPSQPCGDCPLRRDAMPGWLGGATPEEYRALLHSDMRVDCHTLQGPQCAGAAIYRSNVCKSVLPEVLKLPVDREAVFSNPMEFVGHHEHGLSDWIAKRRCDS